MCSIGYSIDPFRCIHAMPKKSSRKRALDPKKQARREENLKNPIVSYVHNAIRVDGIVSISDFARLCDLPKSNVYSWSVGETVPGTENFFVICWALDNVSPGLGARYMKAVKTYSLEKIQDKDALSTAFKIVRRTQQPA